MVIKGHLLFDFISMEENLGNKKMLELNFELIGKHANKNFLQKPVTEKLKSWLTILYQET